MKRDERQELLELRLKVEKRKEQIKKANATYNEKVERLNVIVPIGTKEKIAVKAEKAGYSISGYIRQLILSDLEEE